MSKKYLKIANLKLKSRLIVGTGKYKSFQETAKAVKASGADMVTVAVRRVNILDKKKPILTDYLNPKKIILIDYPGFNLRIAQKIKKFSNIQITYYISPQLWAWKEKRVETIRNNVDDMIVVFPFEKQWYKNRNIDAKYFGHPIIDNCKPYDFSKNNSKL